MGIRRKEIGLFMIHGFSGTNEELGDLEAFFEKKGIPVRIPLLAGHGTKPEDLLGFSPDDWARQAETELHHFEQKVNRVFLGGVSFGGNLAVHLAAKNHRFQGLFLLGTVIKFYKHRLGRVFLPVVEKFKTYYTKRVNAQHFFEQEAMKRRKAYDVAPLKNVVDMFRYIDSHTKKELPKVSTPAMILHSVDDKAVKPSSAPYIFRHIGSKDKELHWIHHSHHNLVIDKPRLSVFSEMYDFMMRHL